MLKGEEGEHEEDVGTDGAGVLIYVLLLLEVVGANVLEYANWLEGKISNCRILFRTYD
jgi:hypothetical protein